MWISSSWKHTERVIRYQVFESTCQGAARTGVLHERTSWKLRATSTQVRIGTPPPSAGKLMVTGLISSPVIARQLQGDDSSSRPGHKVQSVGQQHTAWGQVCIRHSGKDQRPLGWAPAPTCRRGVGGGPRWDGAIWGCWCTQDTDASQPPRPPPPPQVSVLTTQSMLSFPLWPCKCVVWSTKK